MRFFAPFIAATLFSSSAFAGQVWLTMDQVHTHKLDAEVTQIVVGNPGIADVKAQGPQRVLLFGKAPGQTNIVFFNAEGETVENLSIRVNTAPNGMLTFYRGPARTTYNCTKTCEATVTIGDSGSSFDEVVSQTQRKFEQAISGGEN